MPFDNVIAEPKYYAAEQLRNPIQLGMVFVLQSTASQTTTTRLLADISTTLELLA